jgi:hypothetical protein
MCCLAFQRCPVCLQIAYIQPPPTSPWENGWPFRKRKHDTEVGSSRSKKKKTSRSRRYVPVELAHWLFEENRLVPWRDADMTSGG